MVGVFIISDFYMTSEVRTYAVYPGYVAMAIGALVFAFNAEREIDFKSHVFSIVLLVALIFLIIDFFILIVEPIYVVLIIWVPYIFILLIYIFKSSSKIKEYRLNIYAFFFGFLILGLGYGMTADFMVNIIGQVSRLIGDGCVVLGICLISIIFMGIPSFREFEWEQGIRKIVLLQSSGRCICDHDFAIASVEKSEQVPTQFVAGGLIGISQIITELVKSKKKLEIVDHQDKKIIFAYGDYLIASLIADSYLEIYRRKLKKLLDHLEIIYHGILDQADQEVANLDPIKRAITRFFSA